MQQEFPDFVPSTITYSEDVKGWSSFKSFIPENGLSLNKQYYTMKKGKLYLHHSNQVRNQFYDETIEDRTPSSITAVLNPDPSLIKIFNTLGPSKKGWHVTSITTDKQAGFINEFIEKEGKWSNYIRGSAADPISTADLSFQGIGSIHTVVSSGGGGGESGNGGNGQGGGNGGGEGGNEGQEY
jgi:uncharacterized membrane protein YgcG